MRLVRNSMLALAALGFAIVAAPSCDDDMHSDADCAYVARRCRTFCDYGYGCDSYWGCCYDRCWYDCYAREHDDAPSSPSSTPPPSSTPTAPPATDAGSGADASAGIAVLCAPCTSNDQCKGGGLCIQRGGEDAGASGFCGSPCSASTDCPADFACTQIGQSQQCVPTSGVCN